MRIVDYLDKGASLDPEAPCLTTDGESMSYAAVRALSHRRRRRAGRQRGASRATRSRSCRPTTRWRSPASSGSAGPARSGARSTRATRRPRTASCSTCSTARWWCSRRRSSPWSSGSATTCPKVHTWVCLDDAPPTAPGRGLGARWAGRTSWPAERRIPGRPPRRGRPGHDRRDGRDHRTAQGRDAHRHQPRDDDGADPDGLPVPRGGRSTSPSPRSPTPRACCASRSCAAAARS